LSGGWNDPMFVPINADEPSAVKLLLGVNVTEVNTLHPANTAFPIVVTLSGILSDLSDVQF
jgi:hypothetical protein